jgi:hypothetical protein
MKKEVQPWAITHRHIYKETTKWWNPFSDIRCKICNKPEPRVYTIGSDTIMAY